MTGLAEGISAHGAVGTKVQGKANSSVDASLREAKCTLGCRYNN